MHAGLEPRAMSCQDAPSMGQRVACSLQTASKPETTVAAAAAAAAPSLLTCCAQTACAEALHCALLAWVPEHVHASWSSEPEQASLRPTARLHLYPAIARSPCCMGCLTLCFSPIFMTCTPAP